LLGYIVTETGTSARILAHAIGEKLMLSSSGALVAATEGSSLRTQPGLATVVQYDLRIP
jgi:hypothetical protein